MTISVPDTLTTDNSEKYIMSIRLRPDGLSFSAHNPSEAQSFFYREKTFDRNMPYAVALKEIFFVNECLTWTYKRTSILCVSTQYTLVPASIFNDRKRAQFISFNFSSPEKRSMVNEAGEGDDKIVFGLNEDVYEFCARSTTNPRFVHHITAPLTELAKQSCEESDKRMYVIVHQKMLDIIRFDATRLVFVNSFEFNDTNDMLYYILYTWKQTGMNQLHDVMLLSGDTALCTKINDALQIYIRYIGRMKIPDRAYLLGGEILRTPVDLMLFMSCE
jgi:hypothetical protein